MASRVVFGSPGGVVVQEDAGVRNAFGAQVSETAGVGPTIVETAATTAGAFVLWAAAGATETAMPFVGPVS